jgi:flagellum-specific peptidoglycan hydrolase FlgJ
VHQLRPAPRPRWQQATALVSLGAGGVVTGLSFVPGSPADLVAPASLPFALMALEKSAQPAPSDDALLRSAIVHVARHFLRMAERNSPAEMEAMIWRHASVDGADHGASCAAFASLTLELGSHVVGQQSWVTGGTSYPWPLHEWADARVDPNPDSPEIVSVLQDAQLHRRWHPIGDGYYPQPGDWVLFDGHVEVVTKYAGGTLRTIGGDSLPDFSVNAHSYPNPLSQQGVAGFVNNGLRTAAGAGAHGQGSGQASDGTQARSGPAKRSAPSPHAKEAAAPAPGTAAPSPPAASAAQEVLAPRAIPQPPGAQPRYRPESGALAGSGAQAPPPAVPPPDAAPTTQPDGAAPKAAQPLQPRTRPRGDKPEPDSGHQPQVAGRPHQGKADIPATGLRPAVAAPRARPGQAQIPGVLQRGHHQAPPPRQHPAPPPGELAPYQRHQHTSSAQPALPGSASQRAFIDQVAPGAVATQRKYGVPASVTIAQAIDESGWGQSLLATQDHNLFGIKGTGPAGSDLLPTQEFSGGRMIDTTAPFRIYHDIGQSIEAHGKLLARSEYFTHAMSNKHQPNAFAAALTGVYATDPAYGTKLVDLMQRYDLYRFDVAARAKAKPAGASGAAAIPGTTGHANPAAVGSAPAPLPGRTPDPARAPAAGPGSQRARAHRPAGIPAAGTDARAASGVRRSASADPGWMPDSAVPGTGQDGLPAEEPGEGHSHAVAPGQAEIPGLPQTTAAAAPRQAHHARIAPRLRPGHAPGSARPARPAPSSQAGGNLGDGAPAGPTVGHPAGQDGRAHAAPKARASAPAAATIPGVNGPDAGPAGVQPSGSAPAGLGDMALPGLRPAVSAPAGYAADGGDAMLRGGAVIPGLPWDGSDAAGRPHRAGVARHGSPAAAANGMGVAPTHAQRFVPGGQRPAAPGPIAASRDRTPVASNAPALAPPRASAPGPAAPAAAVPAPHRAERAPGPASRAPASAHRGAAAPARVAAPRSAAPAAPATPPPGGSAIPGVPDAPGSAFGPAVPLTPAAPARTDHTAGANIPGHERGARPSAPPSPAAGAPRASSRAAEPATVSAGPTGVAAARYSHRLPPATGRAYLTSAKVPLVRGASLYADVASYTGIPWEVLAACDWMQCKAKPGLSPVYGEKLGTVNPDGTSYRTRSAALERCSYDLVELARSVYQIDVTRGDPMSVRELANVFAAYRWGGLLKQHHTSAMEFPYSVAGLTPQHMHMRWPNIDDPEAPDKPGTRFHKPFGAVPVVLSLDYPATA